MHKLSGTDISALTNPSPDFRVSLPIRATWQEETSVNLETVNYQHDGGVAIIKLNRPQAGNALSAQLASDLLAAASNAPAFVFWEIDTVAIVNHPVYWMMPHGIVAQVK